MRANSRKEQGKRVEESKLRKVQQGKWVTVGGQEQDGGAKASTQR